MAHADGSVVSTPVSPVVAEAGSRVTALLSRAHALYNDGDFAGCLQACQTAECCPGGLTDVRLLLLAGACLFQLRDYAASLQYSQRAVQVHPHLAEAYSNMANVYKEQGDGALAEASEIALRSAVGGRGGGMRCCKVWLLRRVQGMYRKAIELKPEFAVSRAGSPARVDDATDTESGSSLPLSAAGCARKPCIAAATVWAERGGDAALRGRRAPVS